MTFPIHAQGISRRYGKTLALRRLDLTVKPGEIVALLGPNGAGKTTTLKILSGILEPTEGEVRIAGHDLFRDAMEAKRQIAYLPDRPHLYERLTAWEFLKFVASLWNLPRYSWEPTAKATMERLFLGEEVDDLIENYSYGMRQKVVFAAGLIHAPRVWILDEPMSGLDPRAAMEMGKILREEAARGCGIFLSTHTLDLAVRFADRLLILDDGRVVAEGSFKELQDHARQIQIREGLPPSEGEQSIEEVFLHFTRGEATAPKIG